MKKTISVLLAVFLMNSAAQADMSVVCTAEGRSTGQWGNGLLLTDARISFEIEDFDSSRDEAMSITGVHGYVKVGSSSDTTTLDEDNAYIGHFYFSALRSNPQYRPIRYKNMVQFKGFNAERTTGQESGMWGQFLIERNLSEEFEAKYIFQAGDHMGGVVHFYCKASS